MSTNKLLRSELSEVLYVSMAAAAPTAHLLLLSSATFYSSTSHSLQTRKGRRILRIRRSKSLWKTVVTQQLQPLQTLGPRDFSRSALLGARSISLGWKSRRIGDLSTTPRASVSSVAAAGGSSVQSLWHTVFAKLSAALYKFLTQLERIQVGPVGGADILAMVRLLLLGCTAVVAYVASKRAWGKIREHAAGKEGGDGGPMQVLARGATCVQSNMGPWSLQDFTLGLAAMAKVTEKEPPQMPGKEVEDPAKDPQFLMRAQHWRALAEAAYVKDSASFSLFSQLPESSIVACEWEPCQDSFRPAYVVFVDPPMGAVVLAVRGTSHVIDMLLNSGTSPEPFSNSSAHGGFVHATNVLYEQALPHLEKAFKDHGDNKLVITGHSLGAAVGAMCGLRLREKFPNLECWAFCPPACLTLELAKECSEFTTSFVAAHDLVPRFSLTSVENLRERINNFDWDRAEKVAKDDDDWQNIKKALDTMRACQQAQEDAMKTMNEKVEQISNSETGQKVKERGQQAGDKLADSGAAEKIKGAGQQASDYIEGNESNDEKDGEDKGPMPTLYPPGKLLVLGSDPPGCGKMPERRNDVASERNYGTYPTFDEAKNIRWIMHVAQQEELEEIVVSPWCISDHMLGNMCEAIGYFQGQCPPATAH